MSRVLYTSIDEFSLMLIDSPSILDFSSLVPVLFFTYNELCYFTMTYVNILFVFVTKYITYFTQSFRLIHLNSDSYSHCHIFLLNLKKCCSFTNLTFLISKTKFVYINLYGCF